MSLDETVARHYESQKVRDEIARFAKGRWVGVHCTKRDEGGRPVLIRYLGGGRLPLKIESSDDVSKLLRIFGRLGPRTFYATANLYANLRAFEDLAEPSNLRGCSPTWDVDNAPEDWRSTITVVREIVSFLEECGVQHSYFIKWSGRGCHVHVHHGAISADLRKKFSPLDLAYAVVEYVNVKLHDRYTEAIMIPGSEGLRVDNEMDPQRLFSCPLTLHKELDRVCVCVSPNDLESFTPEWADINSFRHYDGWDRHVVGEADDLAEKAYEAVGPCPSSPRFRRRRHPPLDKQISRFLSEK